MPAVSWIRILIWFTHRIINEDDTNYEWNWIVERRNFYEWIAQLMTINSHSFTRQIITQSAIQDRITIYVHAKKRRNRYSFAWFSPLFYYACRINHNAYESHNSNVVTASGAVWKRTGLRMNNFADSRQSLTIWNWTSSVCVCTAFTLIYLPHTFALSIHLFFFCYFKVA